MKQILRNLLKISRFSYLTETVLDSNIYKRAIEVIAIGNRAIQSAREDLRNNWLPIVFSRNGKVYYELPDGSVTDQNPMVGK